MPENVQVPTKFCGEKLVILTVRARPPNLTVWFPISIEVMLNGVNVALVAFNRARPDVHTGQVFTFFMIAAAAAEAAIGLAIVLSLYRLKRTVRSDEADLLKN